MPEPKRPLKVFLCHAHADRDPVRGLYSRLTKDGVDAWLDKANLLPGQDWELEIRKAVREADVVVVCLSKQFNQAGFRQKEVRIALEEADKKVEGDIFIIPARLEECDTLESLRKWHWVDLFEDDGYEMLMRAFRVRANKIGATLQTKKSWLPKITQSNPKNAVAVEQKKEVALPKVEPTEKPKQEKSKKDIEHEAKELADRASRIRQEMLRKLKWDRFLIAAKYRLAIIRVYRLPILFFSVAIALLLFLVFYLQKNLPRLTQALDSTPKPSQTSTGNFLPTNTFTPIPTSKTPTLTVTPTKFVTVTPKPLPTEITDAKGVPMVLVPAGEFAMGSNNGNENPTQKINIGSFYIDKYEVTNAQYADCVSAGICNLPKSANLTTPMINHSYYGDSEYDKYPMININWYNANTYCQWRNARLPTESEWEKSARSTDGRTYPWGEGLSCDRANYGGGIKGCWTSTSETAPVGTYPTDKSVYGIYDLAGNVAEWVSSLYKPYPYNPSDGREDLNASGSRVLRGGSWNYEDIDPRSSIRHGYSPATYNYYIGFRCARSIP